MVEKEAKLAFNDRQSGNSPKVNKDAYGYIVNLVLDHHYKRDYPTAQQRRFMIFIDRLLIK